MVIVLAIVSQVVLITDASNQLNSSWTNLNRTLNTVSDKPGSELTLSDFRRLESGINDLSQRIATLKSRTRLATPLLAIRADWEISYELLNTTQSLTAAAHDMLTALEPALVFMVGGEEEDTVATQFSSGERVIELLEIGQGRFVSATQHLDSARVRLDALDLNGVSADMLLRIDDAEQYYDQLHDINALMIDLPVLLAEILGLNETQNYLILAQNNDELRPSGGYISTYGWMTVRNGSISNYSYSPTTITSPFPPPESFIERFEIPDWWIQYRQPVFAAWDGSWHAHFPATAEMARQYYEVGGNPNTPVDGVIAIDIVGFEYILEALGSVRVTEYDTIITPETFREVIYDIRAYGEGETPHKRFVASVYQQIISDWRQTGRTETTNADLWGAVLRALQEKHIMIYFADPEVHQAMSPLRWSGTQSGGVDHDYVMAVDANLGNKSNHSISRQFTYDVDVQPDGSLHSRLTVGYNYPAIVAEEDPAIDARYHGPLDYNNLLQVFVPTDSTFVDFNNLQQPPDVITEADMTAFVSRVNVPYDGGERFQFEYTTPPLIGTVGPYNHYRLLLQKQPGTINEPVSVQIRLPLGAQVIRTSPEPLASYELDRLVYDFRVDLNTDQWLEIIYQDPPTQ